MRTQVICSSALVVILSGALACTDSRGEVHGEEAGPANGDSGGPDATEGESFRISMKIPDVEPGVENTMCATMRLGNPEAFKVSKIHNVLSSASHHLVVSAVEDPNEVEKEPYECRPFRAVLIGAPLTVTQKHDDVIAMPPGVGFPLVENQMMNLEMHFINSGTEKVDIEASSELFAARDDGTIQEASFIIVGNLDIQIPPRTEHALDFAYVPLPEEFADASFYAATGHTHRFGTAARLQVAAGEEAAGETVYDPTRFDWAEPELAQYDPPFHVPAGGGFRFSCSWDNPTDETITYGESAMQEMCFFWMYYYPRREGRRTLLTGVEAAYGNRNEPADAGDGG